VVTAGVAAIALGYLLGSLPFGYWLARLTTGRDVREIGSGSTGATNVARAAGWTTGAATLALDAGKGVAAAALAAWLAGDVRWAAAAGVAAIVGHSFPVFLRFRGGKSVATGLGVFAYLTPLAAGAALAVWAVAVAIGRRVSLGSVLAAAAYPLLAFALHRPSPTVMLAGVFGAGLIIARHSDNLRRLAAGTEPQLGSGTGK
jgi:glycerol-3-phosphate acyltransferase PlsY